MKCRALAAILVLLLLLGGCQILGLTSGRQLDEVYQPALQECLRAIPELFPDKHINTTVTSVRYLAEREYASVILLNGEDATAFFQSRADRFWVFTIGNSSGFEYVQMVCSSQTDELAGYIPTS